MNKDLATAQGERAVAFGLIVNASLAGVKLVAGIVGNSYALVADAVESTADIFASIIVLAGLRIASREPDESYPFGYGRAESLAGAIVALMLLAAAVGIAVESVREIRTPHHTPAPWTLLVLVLVIVVKWYSSRRVQRAGAAIGSTAVQSDAAHHLSDAITSAAAFVGISVALLGGPGWEEADDWAALFASGVIVLNGVKMLRPAIADLMDRHPGEALVTAVRDIASGVPGVLAIEKTVVRKTGLKHYIEIHVQADGNATLDRSHAIGGHVKAMLKEKLPATAGVIVHMEPFDGDAKH
jgi:cation diffusion facilitator family transporter